MRPQILAILALPLFVSLAGCITPRPSENAAPVEIKGSAQLTAPGAQPGCSSLVPIFAYDETEGRAKETAWIERNHPGATVTGRRTMMCGETPVDNVTFTMADGSPATVLFDIAAFAGKEAY